MDTEQLREDHHALLERLMKERDDARRERDEARALAQRVADESLELHLRINKQRDENAALKAEAERLKWDLQGAMNKSGSAHYMELAADRDALRARLERAEAVCEAANSNIVSRLEDYLNDDAKRSVEVGITALDEGWLQSHARMVKLAEALAKWREGKGA